MRAEVAAPGLTFRAPQLGVLATPLQASFEEQLLLTFVAPSRLVASFSAIRPQEHVLLPLQPLLFSSLL